MSGAPGAEVDTGEQSQPSQRLTGWAWPYLLLLAGSLYVPLDVWASNAEGPVLVTTLATGGAIFVLSVGAFVVMRRLGGTAFASALAIAGWQLVFWTGADLLAVVPLGRIGVLVLALIIAWLLYGLGDLEVVRVIAVLGGFVLIFSPLFPAAQSSFTAPGELSINRSYGDITVNDDRDVVVVVVDGYANRAVLDEFYDFDNGLFLERLSSLGFTVVDDVRANYSHTQVSAASVLQMEKITDREVLTGADLDATLDIMGGQSSFARALANSGYHFVYVESGWLGTQCRDIVDECIPAPWPDETFFDITARSVLKDVSGFETGRTFSRGAVHTMDWLSREIDGYLTNQRPDFIYAHILAPHPPLFLDSECESHPSAEMSGFVIGTPDATTEELEAKRLGYIDQLECVNTVLLATAEKAAGADAVAVILGDHGPDLQGQLFGDVADWNESQVRERFGPLLVLRGDGCDFNEIETLAGALGPVIECLGGPEMPPPPNEVFGVRRLNGEFHLVPFEAPRYETASR